MVAEKDLLGVLPPGVQFNPSDEQLLGIFLTNKLVGGGGGGGEIMGWQSPFVTDVFIPTADLYGDGAYPWRVCRDLAYQYGTGSTEFYCFTPRKRRYGGGVTPDRTVGLGTWISNGGDRCVYSDDDGEVLIGHRAHLTFKMLPRGVGGAGAQKSVQKSELENTNWVMHEYRLERPGFQEMVLCRVRNLRKEHDQKKKVWSTPWWELQEEVLLLEGGGRGGNCRDYRKRKAARCGEKDAAAAHERKLLRRRGHLEEYHQDQQPRYSQLLEAELLQIAEFINYLEDAAPPSSINTVDQQHLGCFQLSDAASPPPAAAAAVLRTTADPYSGISGDGQTGLSSNTCAVPASGGSLLVDHPSSCNGTGSSFFSDMDNSLLNFEDVMICDWKEGGAEEAEESMSFAIPDLWD